MVIVGPRRHHDVGVPLANGADHLPAHFERGHQFAIVVVHDLVFGDARGGGPIPAVSAYLRLASAAAAHLLVAGVAVGDRNEFHRRPGLHELGRGPAELPSQSSG